MKLKDLGDAGNIIAAVGVIISLLIVAWQIRLNTAAMHADANLSMTTIANETLFWNDPEFADLAVRGAEDLSSLDQVERLRYTQYWLAFFNAWEQGFIMNREGLMLDGQWHAWDAGMFSGVNAGARTIWSEVARYYSAGFQDHVKEKFRGNESPSSR